MFRYEKHVCASAAKSPYMYVLVRDLSIEISVHPRANWRVVPEELVSTDAMLVD